MPPTRPRRAVLWIVAYVVSMLGIGLVIYGASKLTYARPHWLWWPDWFFLKIPSAIVIGCLVAVAIILVMWGLSLVRQGYAHRHERHRYTKRDPRYYRANNFEFWLGSFMMSDASLYVLLASALVVSEEHTLDLWVFLLFVEISLCGIMAFYHWARSRLPRVAYVPS